jgi:hypothetical protein
MDFSNSARLNAKFQPNRASTGTVMGINGLIGVVGTQTPRFQYNQTTGACEGYLVEEQRTNLQANSADFSVYRGWAGTLNATTAPDGSSTADLCTASAIDNYSTDYGGNAGATVTWSVFVKTNTATAVTIGDSVNVVSTTLTFSTGVVTGAGVAQQFPDGWWRFSITYVKGNQFSYAGINLTGGSAYLWGGQYEVGGFVSSYIPTTTTSVTRAADVPYIDSGEFYTSRGGALFFEGSPRDDNNSSKSVYLTGYFNGSTERLSFISDTTGSALNARYGATALALGTLPSTATSMKLVTTFDPTNFAACRNGGVVQSTTGTFAAGANRFFIGNTFFGSGAYTAVNGIVKKVAYWPSKLTNAQLQKLTA